MSTETDTKDWWVAAAIFAATFGFFWSYSPLSRAVGLDPATWDYMSVGLTHGLIPYRDVFLHKTPGGAFLGSIGATVAPLLGLRPVAGAHLLFLIFGAVAPALLFLVLRSRTSVQAAAVAAVFMVAFDEWPAAAGEGVRPKVATVMLGLAALLAADKGRFATAGATSAMATLCWQPGLAFGVGCFAPLWSRERRRNATWPGALLRLVGGGAGVVGCFLVWLWWYDALGHFFEQAVGFNTSYIDSKARGPLATFGRIGFIARQWNPQEMVLAPAVALAFLGGRAKLPAGFVIASAGYLGMSFISFQAWPDMILFAPFAGAFLGVGLYQLLESGAGSRAALGLALTVGIGMAVVPHNPRMDRDGVTFDEQAAAMAELAGDLTPEDSLVVVSVPEILIHLERRNGWKWPYMWFGVDQFAAEHTEGGFGGILADLEAKDPKLILVARRWFGPLRRHFDNWARHRYDRTIEAVFPHAEIHVYRRKD